MELYTEEHFDLVRARYLRSIITQFENISKQSRDSEFAQKTFIEINAFMIAFNTDDTTKTVTESFSFFYKMGYKFEWILNSIENDLWKTRKLKQDVVEEGKISKTKVKYFKILGIFNLKMFPKEHIEYDNDGNINVHKKFTYDFSFNKLKKLRKEQNPTAQGLIFNHEIRKTEYIISPQTNKGWIQYEAPTKKKLFKILVKYKAQEEFAEYVRNHGIFNTSDKESIFGSDIKKTPSPTLKHTRNRQVLTLYFLLEALGLENHLINKSDIARLLHLLSAEEIPVDEEGIEKMENSRIYSSIKRSFNRELNDKFIIDLEFIKSRLEPLATEEAKGIKHIVETIKKEIKNIKK